VVAGYTNVAVTKLLDGRIEFDPHVTGLHIFTVERMPAVALAVLGTVALAQAGFEAGEVPAAASTIDLLSGCSGRRRETCAKTADTTPDQQRRADLCLVVRHDRRRAELCPERLSGPG
jgi:uncharacterized protein involved in response to NO